MRTYRHVMKLGMPGSKINGSPVVIVGPCRDELLPSRMRQDNITDHGMMDPYRAGVDDVLGSHPLESDRASFG